MDCRYPSESLRIYTIVLSLALQLTLFVLAALFAYPANHLFDIGILFVFTQLTVIFPAFSASRRWRRFFTSAAIQIFQRSLVSGSIPPQIGQLHRGGLGSMIHPLVLVVVVVSMLGSCSSYRNRGIVRLRDVWISKEKKYLFSFVFLASG